MAHSTPGASHIVVFERRIVRSVPLDQEYEGVVLSAAWEFSPKRPKSSKNKCKLTSIVQLK